MSDASPRLCLKGTLLHYLVTQALLFARLTLLTGYFAHKFYSRGLRVLKKVQQYRNNKVLMCLIG